MMEVVREGDSVIVWKLDRLGRSLKDLIELVGEIQSKGADFISIKDSINTQTAHRQIYLQYFCLPGRIRKRNNPGAYHGRLDPSQKQEAEWVVGQKDLQRRHWIKLILHYSYITTKETVVLYNNKRNSR